MRVIFLFNFLLCLLFFSALAHAADEKMLPEKYLGYWEPHSKTTADVGMDILPDGKIYDFYQAGKKYQRIRFYRFIHTTPTHSYIAVYNQTGQSSSLDFWRLSIEEADYRSKDEKLSGQNKKWRDMLIVQYNDCAPLTLNAFITSSQEELYDLLNAQECSIKDLDRSNANMNTFIRPHKQ